MAHFAELNADNMVLRVVVIDNKDCLDENGVETEAVGVALCQSLYGSETRWQQTSYSGSVRGQYAAAGYVYDEATDEFVRPYPADWYFDVFKMEWVQVEPLPEPEETS